MVRIDEIVEPGLKRVEEILTPVDLQGDFPWRTKSDDFEGKASVAGVPTKFDKLPPKYVAWQTNGKIFIYRINEQTPVPLVAGDEKAPPYIDGYPAVSPKVLADRGTYTRVTPPKKLVAKGILTPDDLDHLRKYLGETPVRDFDESPGGIGYLVTFMPGQSRNPNKGVKDTDVVPSGVLKKLGIECTSCNTYDGMPASVVPIRSLRYVH